MVQKNWSYGKKNSDKAHLEQWDYSEWPRNNYFPGGLSKGDISGIDPLEFARAKMEIDSIIRGYLGLRSG